MTTTGEEYVPYSNASIDNVGDGWRPIIIKALTAIAQIDPGATVIQIKEKFGGLRLYMQASEDAIEEVAWAVYALAHAAEQEAGNRCEECGGFPVRNEPVYKWYRTLCVEHRAEAWVRAHERMTSPASEFPVSDQVAIPDREVEFDMDDDLTDTVEAMPEDGERYTGDVPEPVEGD